jgi:hypothetical protein
MQDHTSEALRHFSITDKIVNPKLCKMLSKALKVFLEYINIHFLFIQA